MKEQNVEPTHSFEVDEAIRLGSIEKAIIVKEIRRMQVYKIRMDKNPWVYYSATALAEKFPYLSSDSIKRWMRELEEAGELVSKVENKVKYDHSKSYAIPHLLETVGQNDPSAGVINPTIPPLSTPLLNTDFAKTKSSLPKTAIRASRGLRAYDESISPEDGLTVDLDTGEVIPEKTAKPRREPKNKLAMEACKYFQRACELAGASKPALTDKGYFLVLRSISNGLIDAKLLRKRMDDWFAEGHPVEKACQITHCFSDYAINAWKAINGI